MNVGGLDRSYRLYVPAGLASPAPLVVMMHGGFGTGLQAERAYGWDELADGAKFVVAYPDGVGRAWNVGGCCGRPGHENIDDVGFINALGISNGGMLAYALACNTGTFAAISPDSATQLDKCAAPHPTSVVHIHGTADPRIRYDGDPGSGVATPDGGPTVPDLNAFWRNVDRCAPPGTTTDGTITTSTANCPDGRDVVLITVDGGGHEWPSFATEALWQFFAAH
jgi:polyhydroxybutyrate depolymerase